MVTGLRYSTILFDFDGTLTNSLPIWLKAYQYAFKQYGIDLTDEEVVRNCFYKAWEEVVKLYKLPSEPEFGAHIHHGLEATFHEAELFEDVLHVLEGCHSHGVKMGIVTSSTRRVVTKALDTLNLTRFFGAVITADDITHFKPHPEPVHLALKALDRDSADAIFVGDASVDMLAAHAAGLDKALFLPDVHSDFYNFEDLRKHEPHFVFHKYSDLATHLALVPVN